ncbi:hypothetical protein Tco_0159055 [Tanacetum coccineum]
MPTPLTQGAKAGVHGTATAEQEIPVTDDVGATKAAVEPDLEKEVISIGSTIKKRRRQRDGGEGGSNAPAKVLGKDHDAARAEHKRRGGKSQADMSVVTGLPSYPQSKQDVAHYADNIFSFYCSSGRQISPRDRSRGETRLRNLLIILLLLAPPGYFSELRHLPNDEFLSQYNINLARQVAMGSQLRLRFEQEAKLLKKSMAQAAEAKNSEVTKELEDLRMRFTRIMAAFEDFKKHEDERVNARCTEMDAQLDALSVDFDEELYPHMLTAIAGHQWSNWARIALIRLCARVKYGMEHGKDNLNYPLIDDLEQLKDAPLDVIMASLYLDSDTGEDAPQFIRDLRPSSSQLKIPVYPERMPATPDRDKIPPGFLGPQALPDMFTLRLALVTAVVL